MCLIALSTGDTVVQVGNQVRKVLAKMKMRRQKDPDEKKDSTLCI